ncbi:MAG: hypothetical protein KatS3mg108_1147 [Isosphaeraceae bacterium]|jgi:hypothetical protein|nr:MAG: hypothetical protein KatS3mg108_1147 [Isosphaeraceae bacterium]
MTTLAATSTDARSVDAAWFGLLVAWIACAWWRAHTFAPTLIERTGLPALWPVVSGRTEPLDCDEAAYAYMGRRLNAGARLYRDLAENKPPLGYALFALATRLGGASEWTVRLMPLPLVWATMFALWCCARLIAGSWAAILAAFLYVLLATDPYVYGNSMQLEQAINLAHAAALAALVASRRRPGLLWPSLAGAGVGASTLIRPTAIILLPVLFLLLPRLRSGSIGHRIRPALASALGFAAVVSACVAVLAAQGILAEAWENTVVAARALVAETPAPPYAPPALIRWLTGNADPRDGRLPWPFGSTDWLVWWGRGAWPLWLFSTASLIGLAWKSPPGDPRRAIGAWTLATAVQVVLPGQYWHHYYLLPTPFLALGTAVALADVIKPPRRLGSLLILTIGSLATFGTLAIQIRDYLLVPASELTIRYKGGRQWVALRDLGTQLGHRARGWGETGLQVWGWQSPLYVYSGLDAPSRHFFNNDLVKAYIDRSHPLVDRWKAELMADLHRRPPAFVFCGDRPFATLRDWLRQNYDPSSLLPPSPTGQGLWTRRGLPQLSPAPRRMLRVSDERRRLPQIDDSAPPATTR